MGWLKLDDQYDQHDKIARLHPMAELLDVRGMLSCARRESDGYVAPSQMHFVTRAIPAAPKRISELVASGRWHTPGHTCPDCPQPPDGWQIHDFLAYNPSRADRESDREAARQRMAHVRANKQRTSPRTSGEQPAKFAGSSRNVRVTPAPPHVPSEHKARAKRDADKPAPVPEDYAPPPPIAAVPPPPQTRDQIRALFEPKPLDEQQEAS